LYSKKKKRLIGLSKRVCNLLLVLLTMTSGCVDAIGFLALGQVFTAAMTGNTVLFGLALVHTGGLTILGYIVALLGFIFGAAVGAMLLQRVQKTTGWTRTVTVTIGIELLAFVAFAVIVSVSPQAKITGVKTDVLLLILAFAMGVQGVTARRVGVNGVTTTVITSTLTGLVETVVWRLPIFSQDSGKKQKAPFFDTSLVMWITVIVFYGIGAAICGVVVRQWNLQAIWLPIAIVLIVILTATVSELRVSTEKKTEISV
jgi:uncharacterized membrane protein YoaK (UPF0700 family)